MNLKQNYVEKKYAYLTLKENRRECCRFTKNDKRTGSTKKSLKKWLTMWELLRSGHR